MSCIKIYYFTAFLFVSLVYLYLILVFVSTTSSEFLSLWINRSERMPSLWAYWRIYGESLLILIPLILLLLSYGLVRI